ncbi:hypothetical protein QBC40DRAFT_4054 [Triangularia verruculosa]|uniref:DUF1776-domain-containing protein n=1 Tax=Triangularia verruculosa TaxID=2587418 RepID=A0AAN6XCI9_9PEZI|nr:hypothetical protein QBC40DRAFT_4054 [Triangularia verruculosa]
MSGTSPQEILDTVLSYIPDDAKRYSGEVAQFINGQVDSIGDQLRDTIATWEWVPAQYRPQAPAPAPVIAVPVGALERVQNWVSRHKILTGIVVVATGTVVYRSYRASVLCRKQRKAKRARSGGRLEVVVIAGSPQLPLTRALALDLERKGFIVFIVANTRDDELLIQALARPDIRSFALDINDPTRVGASIEEFARYLQEPHAAIPKGKKSHLHLKSVILIPSLNYQTSPIATIPPSSFADLFKTHLLQPIVTIQAFLPILTARLHPPPPPTELASSLTKDPSKQREKEDLSPKVMVFTPSIISSINPPFHAPEATICSALSAFTEVLAAELRPLQIPVTHMQLGTFDFSGFTPAQGTKFQTSTAGRGNQGLIAAPGVEQTYNWPDAARKTYAKNFVSQSTSAIGATGIRGMKGSSLKDLHDAVFDVIDGSITASTVRVGLGASVYGFVGRWVPKSMVAFMMGIRKVDELATWQGSAHGSPRSNLGGSHDGEDEKMAGSESFISVAPLEGVAGENVWKS